MGHLDAEAIYDLIEGRLEAGRARSAEAHVWRCAECRALHEECSSSLEALRRYGHEDAPAPAGYWEGFWSRFPVAGKVSPSASRRRIFPAVAAAASIAVVAAGAWWAVARLEPTAEIASNDAAPVVSEPIVSEPVADIPVESYPGWEDDVAAFRRVSFTIGSVDPLSKGFALASMAQEP